MIYYVKVGNHVSRKSLDFFPGLLAFYKKAVLRVNGEKHVLNSHVCRVCRVYRVFVSCVSCFVEFIEYVYHVWSGFFLFGQKLYICTSSDRAP